MIDYSAIESALDQNWYELDPDLQRRVKQDAPADDYEWADKTLRHFGGLIGGPVARNAELSDLHPPELVRYDKWANEVGEIIHHPATLENKRLLWEAGYVSGFAADEDARGRPTPGVVLGASSYLLSQADTGLVCSLGMTSGVAGLVDAYAPPDVRDRLLPALRASSLDGGADGSMFLTEREGGSDLGATVHCTAREIGDGRVLINGEKWFCSNIDGATIVLLARPEGAPIGSASLGLYLVPRQLEDGSRNGIRMRRLKDKLGTKSVPTGEVEFVDAIGYALRGRSSSTAGSSDAGGLNRMMEMVNGSRFGVAMMGLGIARRSFLEAAIWAHHRAAKGRPLVDLPLVREQLVDQLAELEAAFALGFECSAASRQNDGARLRRILIPMAKVRLCRLGVDMATFAIELHGGNGYCRDWNLTRQLRDAQCHPIWEGSENICQLDVLRAIRRDAAHEALFDRIDRALAAGRATSPDVATLLNDARRRLEAAVIALADTDPERAESGAARLTALMSRTVGGALLFEQGADDTHKALVATRYVHRNFAPEVGDDVADLARPLLAWDADLQEASVTA